MVCARVESGIRRALDGAKSSARSSSTVTRAPATSPAAVATSAPVAVAAAGPASVIRPAAAAMAVSATLRRRWRRPSGAAEAPKQRQVAPVPRRIVRTIAAEKTLNSPAARASPAMVAPSEGGMSRAQTAPSAVTTAAAAGPTSRGGTTPMAGSDSMKAANLPRPADLLRKAIRKTTPIMARTAITRYCTATLSIEVGMRAEREDGPRMPPLATRGPPARCRSAVRRVRRRPGADGGRRGPARCQQPTQPVQSKPPAEFLQHRALQLHEPPYCRLHCQHCGQHCFTCTAEASTWGTNRPSSLLPIVVSVLYMSTLLPSSPARLRGLGAGRCGVEPADGACRLRHHRDPAGGMSCTNATPGARGPHSASRTLVT